MNENRHTAEELKMYQALPLSVKISMTKSRIRGWINEFGVDGVYVSISGGKDSQVLAHLVKQDYPNVPLVFVNTGLEFDSVREKGVELSDEVLRPSMDFVSVIKKYGYPIIGKEVSNVVYEARKCIEKNDGKYTYRLQRINGTLKDKNGKKSIYNCEKYKYLLDAPFRISDKCCLIMKKKPAKHYGKKSDRKPIVGTMAEESRLRKQQWLRNGCNGFEMKTPISNPISFWTEQDILQYIKQNNLDIASIYGDVVYTDDDGMFYDNDIFNQDMKLTTTGAKRTGCVFCMFGITQDTDRFLKLKEAEPLKYDYVMRGGKFDEEGMWIPNGGLGYRFVIDWLNEHGNLGIKY